MSKLSLFRDYYSDLVIKYATNRDESILYDCSELGKKFAFLNVASDELVSFHQEVVCALSYQLDKQAILDCHDLLVELALHQKLSLERELAVNNEMVREIQRKTQVERSIFSAFPDVIIKLSQSLKILDVNTQFFSLFDDMNTSKSSLSKLFEPAQKIHQTLKHTLSTGKRCTVKVNLISKGGVLCPAEVSVVMIQNTDVEYDGFLLIVRDLSQSIDVENQLVMANQMISDVIEAIPHRIYWLSEKMELLGCNSHFLNDIGCETLDDAITNQHTIKEKYKNIFLDNSITKNILNQQLGAFNSERIIDTVAIQSMVINEHALPLQNLSGETYGVICCYENITHIKQELKKNEQLTEQLNQAQRIDSIGKLAGSIAHDFNNMLSVILGYSQLLARIFKDRDEQKATEYLNRIISASDKAKLLTGKLLSFSKKDIKQLEQINLGHYVEDALVTYSSIIGEDTFIELSAESDCFIQADKTQLDQLLLNLLVNARDAMFEATKDESKQIDINIYKRKQSIMLAIKDNGCGIENEKLQRIFEPFYSTKKDLGTGLGLSTVLEIIKQHKGTITVDSQIHVGTEFVVELPSFQPKNVCIDNKIVQVVGDQETPINLDTGKHIFLVEDEEGVKNLICSILKDNGFNVTAFDNGTDLLSKLKLGKSVPDLLITDLILPNQLNGKLLAEKFKHLYPDKPVLYVSGYSHELISKRGIMVEGISYLKKPFDISELLSVVSDLLE